MINILLTLFLLSLSLSLFFLRLDIHLSFVSVQAVMIDIPHLLLSIPVPAIDESRIEGKKLSLSIADASDLARAYKEQVQSFLLSTAAMPTLKEVIGAVEFALRVFNAENYTGEFTPVEREELSALLERFDPNFHSILSNADEPEKKEEGEEMKISKQTDPKDLFLQRLLTSDGEMASPCLKLPGLLLCLTAIVVANDAEGKPLVPYDCIWRLRVHYRHQIVLKHRSHAVFIHIASCIDALQQKPEETLTVGELLDVSYAQQFYHRRELAEETIARAVKKSGLRVTESVVEGVRTRWQQHQLPQLLLQADGTRIADISSQDDADQPLTILGEHDGHDLLDRPREKPDSEPMAVAPLHPEDKALLLLMCDQLRFHNPHHSLTNHRMVTYIERLLVDPQPSPFAIRSHILLTRSRLEMRRNRVQERAFLQITELVDQYGALRDPSRRTFGRTKSEYFYCVPYPSWWELKTEYADFCFEENLFKTALEMYEEVQDWEKIIECCKKLDKRKRAESLALELIETDPQNPMLWVALGEATRRDEHLWKAWDLADHKMAAPMRALARLALDRERYEDVVKFFDEAVRINPIFGGDWFSLGFACLKMKDWGRGGEAFTRVCQMDPNDAYAWNNLGSIMLRDNKKRPAFNALSQALRQNRRDWRMWQNYFCIGCELREVTETSNALNIALQIAKRQLVLDRASLELFVDNTIAYLRGEILGMSSEAADSADVQESDHVRYRQVSMRENDNCISADAIKHRPVEGDDDGEEQEFSDLAPLGAVEVEGPFANAPRNTDEKNRIASIIRLRHRHRTRALFLKIMDIFVNDPDIYYCAAKLFGFLDGPLAGYAYKVKELCVCHQKDQWEQQDSLFHRTVEALETTFDVLEDAHKEASEAARDPSLSRLVPDPNAKAADNFLELVEQAALSPIPTEQVPGVATMSTGSHEYVKCLVLATKDTHNNVKRTLQAAEPHFGGTELYNKLVKLEVQTKKLYQEVRDEFDM